MDENDGEKRIADLERQLAELRAAGAGRTLTPEQVHNVAFAKPPPGKRGYNEAEVDAFLDRVEAALQDPTDSDTVGTRVGEESGAPGEPIRCLLRPYPSRSFLKREPPLVIDVSKDAIWVRDSNTNAVLASAGLAQVTATPAEQTTYHESEGGFFGRSYTKPLLLVRVPGLPPLIITTPAMNAYPTQYRLSWRGTVGKAKKPGHFVTEEEFRSLAGKFGLAASLEDGTNRA